MSAYYNEVDPFAAQWLRNLIKAGHIADGIVDERSIEDVKPDDLREFTQCHFFAGIGVWSRALRLAGWPDDRRVWTGSCPCQPFSAAGKGDGFADERHLWPAFNHLMLQCRPPSVLGEQVASKDAAPWLDLVQADVEAMGYAFGAVAFPAASVGAPHIRDRTYWVAQSPRAGLKTRRSDSVGYRESPSGLLAAHCGGNHRLAHSGCTCGERWPDACGFDGNGATQRNQDSSDDQSCRSNGVVGNTHDARPQGFGGLGGVDGTQGRSDTGRHGGQAGVACGMGHTESDRPEVREHLHRGLSGQGLAQGCDVIGMADPIGGRNGASIARPDQRGLPQGDGGYQECAATGPINGHWRDADWLYCRDGKWRPVEPGTFPLAHGATGRVGRLRAYGNAIVAQAAQAFIGSVM